MFESAEAPGVPIRDVAEVSSYVAALTHGITRMRAGFPLSLRLIREIHDVLLSHGRGSEKRPGEFRESQNWIGGARPGTATFVPPPPAKVMELMGQLESFLHQERTDMPLLIKAGLVHVQFESIHPFLDGNGRLGRLLITFLLCAGGALQEPILYLSLFFKANRQTYYDLLMKVRTTGNWEAWLDFFLRGVKETSDQAANAARRIMTLLDDDRRKIEGLGRPAASMLRVHQYAKTHPILSIASGAAQIGITFPTVASALEHMQRLGIMRETTGKQRSRLYTYQSYLDILNEGTEPLT